MLQRSKTCCNAAILRKDRLMAFYSIKQSGHAGSILAHIGAFLQQERDILKTALARRRVFHKTVAELSPLSDRDLADIGISRSDIRHIAMDEAMKIG